MQRANHLIYERLLLPDQPSIDDVRRVARDYVAIVHSVMAHVADRYERTPYPGLIDTKFNIVTGEDFPADDPRGPKTVYSWIQGRGLEALVGHAGWFKRHPWADPEHHLVSRLDHMIRAVYERFLSMWQNNDGRLFFFMDPDGTPFVFNPDGRRTPHSIAADAPYNFSDLFGSRGLYAAASYLNDAKGQADAAAYCLAFEDGLWNDRFASDQQQLPPVTPRAHSAGDVASHAPFTIQLATPALMATQQREPSFVQRGLRLIEHVLARHVNMEKARTDLDRYDFWEFVDAEGNPYVDEERLVLDPGHALEFVGLGLKLTRAARSIGMHDADLKPYEAPMFGILTRSFTHGYVPAVGGIRKQIDLLSRQPIDATMPWWSLPETMRAAILCWSIAPDDATRQQALSVFAACHNSFATHYVRPDRHLFAVQTRSETGEVVDVIPATADADPGYHTGLSLLDVLDVIEEATGPFAEA